MPLIMDTRPDTVPAVLIAVRDLLSVEGTWVQEDWARRPWYTDPITHTHATPTRCDLLDPQACQWCLAGGLARILGEDLRGSFLTPLARACAETLARQTGRVDDFPGYDATIITPVTHLIVWNDMPERTWPQVLEVLTLGIDNPAPIPPPSVDDEFC